MRAYSGGYRGVPLDARFHDDRDPSSAGDSRGASEYYAPAVRRDRYSRRPSQSRRLRDVTWISSSTSQNNTSQPNISQPDLPDSSQPNLPSAPPTNTTPRTPLVMPYPESFIPPPPPQSLGLPTPVIGRPATLPTPAIGEHMALPDENEMDLGSYQGVPYVPHRKAPKNRFVGGFINTLRKFPVFGRRKHLRRRSYENVQAPSPIPESQLEEEEAELEDERVAMPQPSEPEPEPERSVASPRVRDSDPVVRMPEPSVSYPATRVHSGNLSSMGTPVMGPIPIERSAAPSPAALRQAFSMMDDDDDDDSLSEDDDDDDIGMPYVPPPRTSTPVHRHRQPRPPTPAPLPPAEPSYAPVIPPLINTAGPSQTMSSSSRIYDPSSRAHSPHNTTFLSQLARFRRFVHEIDQLPFSSSDQIADEYVPSQSHRSKIREQKRGHMASSSWYDSRDRIPQTYIYAAPVPGFGAVPALDAIPPPVHKPVLWNQQWEEWAPGRMWDMMPPPPPSGALGGTPGMVDLNTGPGPSVPNGYAPDRQPVFVYPSPGHFAGPAATPSRW
ncbi:hypothetical protein EV401DRAFT_295225 [Pisolithus croceorrhizus]|nr:hypothetical protein EV401DRAFT_295225 [Pisolithus croceorrhizus]